MSDWRQNPNLVECFESCVAMFRGNLVVRHETERDKWIAEVRRRRAALGMSQETLSRAMGLSSGYIAAFECGSNGGVNRYQRIIAMLERLEAERRSGAAE